MKKIITLITLLVFTTNYATDRLVDPTLSSGNGTTIFTTITAAINAAVNGDRIIIASNTYNEAALTIGKSLQIMPQTPGTIINFNANITISGFPGMKLEITGVNIGIYSISSNEIVAGSPNNRCKITIINCSAQYLDFNKNYYGVNIIDNNISKGIVFRYGNVVKNITKQISLLDEPQDNPNTNEKNLIIANEVTYLIGILNNDYPIIVANNKMRDLSLLRWNANTVLKNIIANNQFTNDTVIHFSLDNVPYYNIIFTSNKFENGFSMANSKKGSFSYNWFGNDLNQFSAFSYDTWMPSWGWCCNGPYGWYYNNGSETPTKPTDFWAGGSYWIANGSPIYLNNNTPGFFEFSYNGIAANFTIPASGSPLNLTNIAGPTNDIDGGNPNHSFYDLDLTINDRGVNGGPYSQLNYNATNPNNSKAFIFDLDMPTDLFPTQTVDIKAKGYHKN
jgi:hypothetical protein